MQSTAGTVEEYIMEVPEKRRKYFRQLRNTILTNLPEGFVEEMNYGMIGYVVPHSIYPLGYHCSPQLPLPFLNIASQKHFIGLYHMAIYAKKDLHEWFIREYPKHCSQKLDMGKSCIRFKNPEQIPFDLIGQLVTKISVQDWISIYEKNIKS